MRQALQRSCQHDSGYIVHAVYIVHLQLLLKDPF